MLTSSDPQVEVSSSAVALSEQTKLVKEQGLHLHVACTSKSRLLSAFLLVYWHGKTLSHRTCYISIGQKST